MGRTGMSHRHVGLFPAVFELLETQLVDDKFHPSLRAVFSIAQRVEYSNHGFYTWDELIHLRELSKHPGEPRGRTESAGCDHSKTDGSIRTPRGQKPDVVNRCERAVLFAAREGNFKFARKALVERIPQKVECNGFGIGRHVEHSPLTDSGKVTDRHIADRVAKSLSGGHTDFGQPSHDGRHIR